MSPAMLKSLTRAVLRKLGRQVVQIGCAGNVVRLESLQEIFEDEHIDLVLDIGANVGQYRDYLRNHIGYGGRIISFEPNPSDFKILEDLALCDTAWDVYPWALGSRSETLILNVAVSTDFSSFLVPTNESATFDGNSITHQVPVDVRTLDETLEDIGVVISDHRTFLKCDTQGFDLEVLRGASKCLPSIAALQSEVSVIPIYKDSPDFLDAIGELRSRGFEVAALHPVSRVHGLVVEFDCVMLNIRNTDLDSAKFEKNVGP